jgi:hypothetical protein
MRGESPSPQSGKRIAPMPVADAERPLRTSSPRKFTLFDAMVLIAAAAIALLPVRLFLSAFAGLSESLSLAYRIVEFAFVADALVCPLALSLSLAVFVLRLRKPRPGLPRVFRQPGMAACTAVLVYCLLFLIATLISLFLSYFASGLFLNHMFLQFNFAIWLLVLPMSMMGITVAAVWILLWLIGAWRPEPSWIDRAGRAVGIYWVANTLLFGSAVLAGLS